MTREEVEEGIKELVEAGLLEDNGERRDGAIVWRLSKAGRDLDHATKVLDALVLAEEMSSFSD